MGHSTGNGGRAASGAQASAPVFVAASSMRRVDCRRCEAVVVEEIQWGDGKTRTDPRLHVVARPPGTQAVVERNS